MNTGKVFEQNFKKSVDKSKIYFVRLKDSPSSFGQDSSKVRFTANNPYDNFCFYERTLFPLELKSTKSTSFSFQRDKKEKSKNIKLSQIEGLTEASKYNGVYAGFVFNFDKGETVWMDIKDFNDFWEAKYDEAICQKIYSKFEDAFDFIFFLYKLQKVVKKCKKNTNVSIFNIFLFIKIVFLS